VAPKLDPVIVTGVLTPPRFGDNPVTKGVVPIVIETLSKVAVANVFAASLLTASPMYTFWAMEMV
jgi:hypothetical protein